MSTFSLLLSPVICNPITEVNSWLSNTNIDIKKKFLKPQFCQKKESFDVCEEKDLELPKNHFVRCD